MKNIVIASLIALAFTTGFTCSKNQPTTTNVETPAAAPTQEQMAAPAAPAEAGAPAEGTAAPAEGAPAAPAAEETK